MDNLLIYIWAEDANDALVRADNCEEYKSPQEAHLAKEYRNPTGEFKLFSILVQEIQS